MLPKILFVFASCIFISDAVPSRFIELTENVREECFSKFGVTSHELSAMKPKTIPESKKICAFLCIWKGLNIFDEHSINEISLDIGYALIPNMTLRERELSKRLYVKLNEVNDNICTIDDVAVRDQKWQDWMKGEIIQAMGIDVTDPDNTLPDEIIREKISEYLSNIPVPEGDENAIPVQSELLNLVKDSVQTCTTIFNITANNESIIDLIKQGDIKDAIKKDRLYLMYCVASELGVIDEHGLNAITTQGLITELQHKMPVRQAIGMISYYNQGIIMFKRNYLKRIGAELPIPPQKHPKIDELPEVAFLAQQSQN